MIIKLLVENLNRPFQKSLEYQPEFNPRVHGPYDPAKFYGKADPLGEVKLGEVGSWISRRKMGLDTTTRLISRALWRYRNKYVIPKKQNGAFLYHMSFLLFTAFYIFVEHPERKNHKWAIYH